MKATEIKNAIETLKEALKNGATWTTLNKIIRESGLEVSVKDIECGLQTSEEARSLKQTLLNSAKENEFIAHRYSVAVKSRRSGYAYNRLFVRKIKFI